MKINPIKVFNDLKECIVDFYQKKIYLSIIKELTESGKLEKAGFRVDLKYNLYLGINLNPELLFYQDTSVETAELRMISEKLKTHTDFLTKEGILDSIKVEYDRIKSADHYGYIVKISYNYKKYKLSKLIYSSLYFLSILSSIIFGLFYLF
jgi:hypothetical protein